MTDWKKVRKSVDERIADVKAMLAKDEDGNPISGPHLSNRSHRRGSGQKRSRIFGEKMTIPKKRKKK